MTDFLPVLEPDSLAGLSEATVVARIAATFERALAGAQSVADVHDLRDKAEAFRAYFAARGGYLEAQNEAAYWKIRSERELGTLMPKEAGGRGKLLQAAIVSAEEIRPFQRTRWRDLAEIEEQLFEAYVADIQQRDEELTAAGLLRYSQAAVVHDGRSDRQETPGLPEGIYNLILADPPWRYNFSNSSKRAVENHYDSMSLDDICALKVAELAARDCVLFLWATIPKLPEAFRVLEAWGFAYKSAAVWRKSGMGMGYWWRVDTELLLTATRGEPKPPAPQERVSNVIDAAKGRHSEKPAAVWDLLERLYPEAKRLELFCREPRPGWDIWGNEIEPRGLLLETG